MQDSKGESLSTVKPPRIFYGWWVVASGALVLTLIGASVWQSTGFFLVALEDEFGWKRTVLSGAFAISRAEGAVMGPVEGFLTDRLGPRRTMLIGFAICVAGFFLFTTIHSPLRFYLAYVLIAGGSGLAGYIPILTTINNWFLRRRSLAMALPQVGANIGGSLVPLIAWGIVAHGWRIVAGGIGAFLLASALPLILLMRDRPERYGLLPDGDPPDVETAHRSTSAPGASTSSPLRSPVEFTARQAMRTRTFWIIAIAHATTAYLISTLLIHLPAHLTDKGLSLTTAGVVVLTLTASAGVFQIIGGWLADRLDKRFVIAGFMVVQGLAMFVLIAVGSLPMALVFGIVGGAGWGGRAPAITSIRGDYFGRRSFGTILGLSMLPMNIGMIFIPLLAGVSYDLLDSYTIPFAILGGLVIAGGALMLAAGPPHPLATAVGAP